MCKNGKMIDPEREPERWEEPILAKSPQEAWKECRRRAEEYNMEVEAVKEPKIKRGSPQVYRCQFKEKE